MFAHLAYILSMLAIGLSVPASTVHLASGALVTIGTIGLWRYSWAAINLARAATYLLVAYPRRRATAEAAYAARSHTGHTFFLVTTYKIKPEISARVYRSIFDAALQASGGATVVASIVDEADGRLIRQVFANAISAVAGNGCPVTLKIDKIAGTGKRDALATSLRSIASLNPTRHDIVVFVDGDSCVPPDVVQRALPFFMDPETGALTTDELAETEGSQIFKHWFDLRFAQRHVMMSSMAMGERVLTLTGRMSAFRADLATDPDFINVVQNDCIDHWRLGRVSFLTGDDKSTWFWLLQRGFKMLYLPDVCTVSIETQPKPGFFESATTLMVRWFGNMLRTNGRALKLPARRIGLFTWWSILDQRVSIWTTIAGPASVLLSAVFISPMVLPLYVAWVMLTRYLFCTVIMVFRGRGFPVTYPFLLYFSQIVGALIKSFVLFRLDRQKWTRQATEGRSAKRDLTFRAASSAHMHLLAISWLVLGVAYIGGLI